MKTKKIIAIASAVILAVSSLAGCGGNNKKVEEGNITLTAYDKNVTTSSETMTFRVKLSKKPV